MKQYIDLLKDILDNGIDKSDRTGVGTRSVFGRTLRFDLSEGFPIITTRKVAFRIAFEETMFFLRGQTDTKILENKNIKIWKGNTTREFLDKRGLTKLPVGDMGKGYSYQWTHWDKIKIVNPGTDEVVTSDGSVTYMNAKINVSHVNQIEELLKSLKNDPNGRRHNVTAWNPGQLDEMALPPCHLYHQYAVNNGKLDSFFLMRSNDAGYGLPYNLMGYAFLNHAFAKILGLEPGEMVYTGVDVHIYQNQMDMIAEQVTREPKKLPTIKFKKDFNTLEELLSLQFEDIEIVGYDPHPDFKDKPPMAV